MANQFWHLHLHSDYSLKDALSKPNHLAKHLLSIGMEGCALSDHGNMAGVAAFHKVFEKNGLKLIAGCEMYVAANGIEDKSERNTGHLTLLAADMEGYHNLARLHSISFNDPAFYFDPRVDLNLLEKYGKGIIALSGCLGSFINKPILKSNDLKESKRRFDALRQIFDGRFYIELQDHQLPEDAIVLPQLRSWAKKYNLPMVATNDSHYVEEGDWTAHDAMIALGTGCVVSDPNRQKIYKEREFFVKTYKQMRERFEPAVLAESVRIADMCEPLNLDSKTFHIPQVVAKPDEALRKKAWAGVWERYGKPSKALTERFEYEYEAIVNGGFTNYLLILADLYDFARSKDIPAGAGRGSAAGSLICYGLGITNIDPIEYDLSFDRFIDRNRISQPDIDADFSAVRAGEIMDYLRERWGTENVSNIITYQTMGAKQALKDCARVLRKPLELGERLAKLIPLQGSVTLDREERHYLKDALKNIKDFKKLYDEDEGAAEVIDLALRLEGTLKTASFHPAGVVIADKPISEYCPMICLKEDKDSKVRTYATAYDMNCIEAIGLLKIDVLSLRNLDVVADCIANAKAAGELRDDFTVNDIPLDDPAAFKLLANGFTQGLFQVEGSGVSGWLRKMQPKTIHDVAVMTALYRPGPMAQIPSYIDRMHGKEAVTYPHPSLEPILESTYSVAVFQEQLIAVAIAIAGWDFTRADKLRKTIGKKDLAEMPKQKASFIEDAVKQGHDEEWATDLFTTLIEPAARYSFGKAHAYSYADLIVKTAWLKAMYPIHYFAALLHSVSGDVERTARYAIEAKHLGVNVLPPDINESGTGFTVTARGITYGLPAIKNVGGRAADLIIKKRKRKPYADLFDFVERTSDRLITSRTVESLVYAGCFDNLPGSREDQAASVVLALDRLKKLEEDRKRISEGKPPVRRKVPIPEPVLIAATEPIDLLAKEREMLGQYVTSHPYLAYADAAKAASTHTLNEIRSLSDRSRATICGIVTNLREHAVKKSGRKMLFACIEDNEVSLDVTVFPKSYEGCREAFVLDKPVVLSGVVSVEEVEGSEVQGYKFFVDSAVLLSEAPRVRRRVEGRGSSRINSTLSDLTCEVPLDYEGYSDTLRDLKIAGGPYNTSFPVHLKLPNGEVWVVEK